MFLSDLQNKDIISTRDGRLLGYISDAKINEQGMILSLVVESKRGLKVFHMAAGETEISFDKITKIGEDVILVDL